MNLFLKFETWLSTYWGYHAVIHFEDLILFLAGIFVGMLLMVYLSGRVILRLQKMKDLGSNQVNLIRILDHGEKTYIANPKNISEAMETLLLVIFKPLATINEYTMRDEKRTKILILSLLVIGVLVLILAFCCIFTIFLEPI